MAIEVTEGKVKEGKCMYLYSLCASRVIVYGFVCIVCVYMYMYV